MNTRALEKVTVVVAVAVLGVALAIGIHTGMVVLLVAALVVTVSAGMDLVLRGEARYRPTPDLFILPGALVVGAVLFLSLPFSGPAIVVGLAVFAGLLFAVFWAEHSIRLGLVQRRVGEMMLTVIGYAAAFLLYAAIYQWRARSLFSAPAIIGITSLLAARQLRLAHEPEAAERAEVVAAALREREEARQEAHRLSLSEAALLRGRGAGSQRGSAGYAVPTPYSIGATDAASVPTDRPRPRGSAPGQLASTGASAPAAPGAVPDGGPDSLTATTALRAILTQRQGLEPTWPQTILYSAVVALAVGEITWVLNYWPLNGLLGGAFLLAAFYFLVGTIANHLQNRLTARLLVEYGSVALASMVAIAVAGILRYRIG